MLTLEVDRPGEFRRYNNNKGYLITVVVDNKGEFNYNLFYAKELGSEQVIPSKYLPRLYMEGDANSKFEAYSSTHIDCSLSDIDTLIDEHKLYLEGLKVAKETIAEFKSLITKLESEKIDYLKNTAQ